jgi:hypothetical protein
MVAGPSRPAFLHDLAMFLRAVRMELEGGDR